MQYDGHFPKDDLREEHNAKLCRSCITMCHKPSMRNNCRG